MQWAPAVAGEQPAMIPASPSFLDQVGHVFQTAFTGLKHALSPKDADCVFIIGPRSKGDVEFLKRHASHAGIKVHFIGDGEHPVTQEMIQDARRAGIIGPNTEVVCSTHGFNYKTPDGEQAHRLVLSEQLPLDPQNPEAAGRISTANVLQWLREPLNTGHGQGDPWSGNVHFMACQVGSFRKQFTVDHKLWPQGHVFLHGSGKLAGTEVVRDNCAELIRHIAYVRRDGAQALDPLETLRQLANGAVDTLMLLGGEFNEALVVNSPKSISEFMPDHLHALWRQQAAEEMLALSHGTGQVGAKQGRHKPAIKASRAEIGLARERQMSNYLLTRLLHLKSKAKLDLLKSDLEKFPAVANLRFLMQIPPLAFACLNVYPGKQEVTATDIACVLLDHGARINDVDMRGASALQYAARRGDELLIELLVSRGADIHQRDNSGSSILHWACAARKEKASAAVGVVLKHCNGIDLNRPDKKGFTPLHLAIKAKDYDMVDALLNAGADPTKRLWFWESPSAMARKYGDDAIAVRLQSAARKWRRKPDARASG